MERELAGLPKPGKGRVAAYYQRRGYMTGTGTLIDELMARVGLVNLARKLGKPPLSQLSLEEMVAAQPDFLIVESATDTVIDQGSEMLHHPALKDIPRISVPQAWTVCGSPAYTQAARSMKAVMTLPRWSLIVALTILTLAAAIASLLFGAVDLSVARLVAAATGDGDKVASIILFDLRLPRTVLALAVGAMLGLAGAALQGYLRNPLAEPSVLGTSNAAALGGVVAIYFGLADIHPVVLPLLATGGALVSLALLVALAGQAESPLTLILAGIAVGTLAVAGTSLALNLSPNPFA
eukprot:gene1805-2368_t